MAEIAESKRAAWMRGEISVHQCFETLGADDCAQARKVFMKGRLQAKPVLAVVDFEPLEGGEAAVGTDELAGNRLHRAAIPAASGVVRLHLFFRRERLHDGRAHLSLKLLQAH